MDAWQKIYNVQNNHTDAKPITFEAFTNDAGAKVSFKPPPPLQITLLNASFSATRPGCDKQDFMEEGERRLSTFQSGSISMLGGRLWEL